MITKRAGVIHPVPLAAHHLKEVVEGGLHNYIHVILLKTQLVSQVMLTKYEEEEWSTKRKTCMLTNERGTPKMGGVEFHLVIVEYEDILASIDKLLVRSIVRFKRKGFPIEGRK